jgi:hypothetical protein
MKTLLNKSTSVVALSVVALATSACTMSASADSNNTSMMGGNIDMTFDQDNDVSLMGGNMDLDGRVGGDVSLIGGDIEAHLDIGGDLSLVGGDVEFRGSAGEASIAGGDINWNGNTDRDLSVAGGDIEVTGRIGGELSVAGGDLELAESLFVEGDASFAGGDVEFDGQVNGVLSAAANQMRIGGIANGRVELAAEPSQNSWSWRIGSSDDGGRGGNTNGLLEISGRLEQGGAVCAHRVAILRGADIRGPLHVWSDEEIDIDSRASTGEIIREDRAGRDCDDIFRDHDRA